jgi:transcriptional regulator with XRE-family HTH domain
MLDIASMLAIVSTMASKLHPLGAVLAEARARKGLSLRQVEAATGISNAYLSQLEGGRRVKEPSPLLLHKLSQLYDVSYGELLQAAGYPVPGADDSTAEPPRIAARLGPTTPDEEDALAEYLRFLRSKTGRRAR